jgi:MFS family permease
VAPRSLPEISATGTPASPVTAGNFRRTVILSLLFAPTTFGASATAVVLPEASHRIGTSVASSSWLVAAYLLALAVGTPIFGRIGDQRGLRVVLHTALVTLAGGVALAEAERGLAVGILNLAFLGGGAAATALAATLGSASMFPGAAAPLVALPALALGLSLLDLRGAKEPVAVRTY